MLGSAHRSGDSMDPVGVFVVDDHEMLRLGLRETFAHHSDIDIVGESDRYEGALVRIIDAEPSVAIIDVELGDGSGIELCRQLVDEAPAVRSLMFTSSTGDEPLYKAIMAGAAGYILKGSPSDDLLRAVRAVARGESLIDPSLTQNVLSRLRSQPSLLASTLSKQEGRVLALIGEGLTNKQIAKRLYLADQTIKNYVSKVLTKLSMSRTRAALYAIGRKEPSEERD